MSQHAIEFLVEETVIVIDAADLAVENKRDLLAGIYKIQAFYDTGYTHFRVMKILLKYGFVQRVEAPAGTTPGWVGDDFAKEEDGKVFLYKDTACTLAVNDVFLQVMQAAEQQGNQRLLNEWYGLLANGYMEGIFENGDIIALAADTTLSAIRELAQRNSVKRLRHSDEDVKLPVMKDEIAMAGGLEKEYVVRFFLDLKKPVEELTAAYEKAVTTRHAGAIVLEELIDSLSDTMQKHAWVRIPGTEKHNWCWYRDEGAYRGFMKLIYEEGNKMLIGYVGIQHGAILKWQQREADMEIANVHFTQMAIASLPEDRLNSKYLNRYGGWKFDVSKSKKALHMALANLVDDWQIATNNYFSFINKEFPEVFFNRDADRLLYLIENGEDETGIIPAYLLFNSAYSIMLVFAYRNHDEKMIDQIRERFNSNKRKSAYEIKYMAPFLETGLQGPMPPLYHQMLAMALMK